MMGSNYYETLGVTANASTKEIRSAYRKLARRFHPDINPNNQVAAARFKEIQIAYDVLGNDEKKTLFENHKIQVLCRRAFTIHDVHR